MGIKVKIDAASGQLTFTATNGEQVVFDSTRVHADNARYAALHGWKQRLVDNAAIPRDKETGKSPTDEERMAGIRRLAEHYMSGAPGWSVRGAAEAKEDGSIVLRALANVQGVSVEEMKARVKAQAEKAQLTERQFLNRVKTAPAVVEEIARLSPPAQDADELLSGLMGEQGEQGE